MHGTPDLFYCLMSTRVFKRKNRRQVGTLQVGENGGSRLGLEAVDGQAIVPNNPRNRKKFNYEFFTESWDPTWSTLDTLTVNRLQTSSPTGTERRKAMETAA